MKDSGIKWIGEIPEKWGKCRLKNVITIENGKEIMDDGGNIPVYGSGGIFKFTDRPIFVGQSLLMGRKGTIDKPMLVDGPFWTVDTMFYTSRIENINARFLYYACSGLINFDFYKSGSVLPSMTQTELYNVWITLPGPSEQQAIAAFLDKKCFVIDNLISNETKQIEKLEEYKMATITKAVTKGLDSDAKMKDSGVEWIGEIPEKWGKCRLKNVITIENGKEIMDDGGNIPVYGSGGIFKFTDRPIFVGQSLLMGRKGTIDKPMLVDGPFWTVDTMFYTSRIENINARFLYYACSGLINFDFYKSGSVLPSMTQTELYNVWITLPGPSEQQEIADYLDGKCTKIKKFIDIKKEKIGKLQDYKKSLIYEYVTGKKAVEA